MNESAVIHPHFLKDKVYLDLLCPVCDIAVYEFDNTPERVVMRCEWCGLVSVEWKDKAKEAA